MMAVYVFLGTSYRLIGLMCLSSALPVTLRGSIIALSLTGGGGAVVVDIFHMQVDELSRFLRLGFRYINCELRRPRSSTNGEGVQRGAEVLEGDRSAQHRLDLDLDSRRHFNFAGPPQSIF